jgi:hypothetical protein
MAYAEDVNYWQTSRTSPDRWMDKARKEIEEVGGAVLAEGFGRELQSNRAAYMMRFQIKEDSPYGYAWYTITWPVLEPKNGNLAAARIQAATALYHHVKSLCVSAKFLGTRTAFFAHLMLDSGRTVSSLSDPELSSKIPLMLMASEKGNGINAGRE